MSRPIKFRAWVIAEHRMVDVDWFSSSEVNCGYHRLVPRDEIILLEFTGLYDKNGKEIFEGDVLEGLSRLAVIKRGKEIAGFSVKLLEAEYGRVLRRSDSAFVSVIGNVYQNPELLK